MNIKERLARIRFIEVKPDLSRLSPNELEALKCCVAASRLISDIYLEQASVHSLSLRRELESSTRESDKDLLAYFNTQGCPWDRFAKDEPFIPWIGAKPKVGTFYPADITEEEWNAWIHSLTGDEAKAFENWYTVIRRANPPQKRLVAVPYSEAYAGSLAKAAGYLLWASAKLEDGPLKKFLVDRAQAFWTNQYFQSELSWVDTNGYPFEVTIGPYEVYMDKLFGMKAAFEAFIALPNKEATEALARFSGAVPEVDRILAKQFGYKPKGAAIPLEVVDDVFRGGEAQYGYVFVAYNLPNDRKVHEQKGSKKVFSDTMMRAKFEHIAKPVADGILSSGLAAALEYRHRLLFVLGHELAHGLGPTTVKLGDREVTVEVALKDLHSLLEEAKADALGTVLLNHFVTKRLLSSDDLLYCATSQVVSMFLAFRKGYEEAHAAGALIQYNWLKSREAVSYDRKTGKLAILPACVVEAMRDLAYEFMRIQSEGDYAKAKAFVTEWTAIPPEVPEIVARFRDLPVEVVPVYNLGF